MARFELGSWHLRAKITKSSQQKHDHLAMRWTAMAREIGQPCGKKPLRIRHHTQGKDKRIETKDLAQTNRVAAESHKKRQLETTSTGSSQMISLSEELSMMGFVSNLICQCFIQIADTKTPDPEKLWQFVTILSYLTRFFQDLNPLVCYK